MTDQRDLSKSKYSGRGDSTRQFSLLIKPVSADCNLRCQYCFYLDHLNFYPEDAAHRMSEITLRRLISGYMSTNQDVYAFIWQGGEPTLLGLDFFRKVTALQQEHGRPGSVVVNAVQTNGTLLTDDLARHFAEYQFLVGISLDGPPEVHDQYRHKPNGAHTHSDVMRGIDCLYQNGVEPNILTLVTEANVGCGRDIYRYFRNQGLRFLQFIPCVEFDKNGRLEPYSVNGDVWGQFLCDLFDEWYPHDTRRASVRLFDSVIDKLLLDRTADCQMNSDCCRYFVVEYNGDVFPCDFFVQRDLTLGNIHGNSWGELQQSPKYAAFGGRKMSLADACTDCGYLELCHGDCQKHRVSPDGSSTEQSVLCSGWKRFFEHSLPGFERLAAEVRSESGWASSQVNRRI